MSADRSQNDRCRCYGATVSETKCGNCGRTIDDPRFHAVDLAIAKERARCLAIARDAMAWNHLLAEERATDGKPKSAAMAAERVARCIAYDIEHPGADRASGHTPPRPVGPESPLDHQEKGRAMNTEIKTGRHADMLRAGELVRISGENGFADGWTGRIVGHAFITWGQGVSPATCRPLMLVCPESGKVYDGAWVTLQGARSFVSTFPVHPDSAIPLDEWLGTATSDE